MILVCPSCDTRYFADDSSIGKEGRRVRCATCGHAWHAKLQEEEGEIAPVAETGLTREQVERLRQTAAENTKARAGPHAEFRAREHAKRKRHHGRAITIAWASGFALFVLAGGAAVLFRNEVAEAFPRAASIYKLVGLDVNRFGLTFENVQARRTFDGTTPVLTVSGSVINGSDERLETPQLRVTLKDEAGNAVQTWTDKFSVPALGPNERTEFASRFEAPPVETYRLTVSFVREDGDEPMGADADVEATKEGVAPAPAGETSGAKPANAADSPAWSGGDGADEHAAAGPVNAEPAAAPAAATPAGESDHH
ncbi:MAG: DUF3426 domain-containing protein [Hyphomonadaceae bacterium]|nr:DUF3426 domain-containing protein [Hyphomonadaceae bacterium]